MQIQPSQSHGTLCAEASKNPMNVKNNISKITLKRQILMLNEIRGNCQQWS